MSCVIEKSFLGKEWGWFISVCQEPFPSSKSFALTLFHTSVTPQTPLQEKPDAFQQMFLGFAEALGVSVGLPRDGETIPPGSPVGNVGEFAESNWSGRKLLVCPPKAALFVSWCV